MVTGLETKCILCTHTNVMLKYGISSEREGENKEKDLEAELSIALKQNPIITKYRKKEYM